MINKKILLIVIMLLSIEYVSATSWHQYKLSESLTGNDISKVHALSNGRMLAIDSATNYFLWNLSDWEKLTLNSTITGGATSLADSEKINETVYLVFYTATNITVSSINTTSKALTNITTLTFGLTGSWGGLVCTINDTACYINGYFSSGGGILTYRVINNGLADNTLIFNDTDFVSGGTNAFGLFPSNTNNLYYNGWPNNHKVYVWNGVGVTNQTGTNYYYSPPVMQITKDDNNRAVCAKASDTSPTPTKEGISYWNTTTSTYKDYQFDQAAIVGYVDLRFNCLYINNKIMAISGNDIWNVDWYNGSTLNYNEIFTTGSVPDLLTADYDDNVKLGVIGAQTGYLYFYNLWIGYTFDFTLDNYTTTNNLPVFNVSINSSMGNGSTNVTLIINGSGYGKTICGNNTVCSITPNASLPVGGYNWSFNISTGNGSAGGSGAGGFNSDSGGGEPVTILDPIYLNSTDLWTNNQTPGFNFTVISPDFATNNCTLYINYTPYGRNDSVLNNTLTTITANATINEGHYIWSINCSVGVGSNYSEINIDIGSPVVLMKTPSNLSWYTDNNVPTLRFNVSDTWDLYTYCRLKINGTSVAYDFYDNLSITNIAVVSNTTFPDNYNYNWTISCEDNANNTGTAWYNHFSIDTTDPVATINSPGDSYSTSDNFPIFNYTCSDNLLFNKSRIVIEGSYYGLNNTCTNNTYCLMTVNQSISTTDTSLNYSIWCYDTAGHVGASTARTITITTTTTSTGGVIGGGGGGSQTQREELTSNERFMTAINICEQNNGTVVNIKGALYCKKDGEYTLLETSGDNWWDKITWQYWLLILIIIILFYQYYQSNRKVIKKKLINRRIPERDVEEGNRRRRSDGGMY